MSKITKNYDSVVRRTTNISKHILPLYISFVNLWFLWNLRYFNTNAQWQMGVSHKIHHHTWIFPAFSPMPRLNWSSSWMYVPGGRLLVRTMFVFFEEWCTPGGSTTHHVHVFFEKLCAPTTWSTTYRFSFHEVASTSNSMISSEIQLSYHYQYHHCGSAWCYVTVMWKKGGGKRSFWLCKQKQQTERKQNTRERNQAYIICIHTKHAIRLLRTDTADASQAQ